MNPQIIFHRRSLAHHDRSYPFVSRRTVLSYYTLLKVGVTALHMIS